MKDIYTENVENLIIYNNSLYVLLEFSLYLKLWFITYEQKWPDKKPHERSDLPPPVTREQLGVRLTRQKRLEEFGAEEADRQQQLQMEEERAIAQVITQKL